MKKTLMAFALIIILLMSSTSIGGFLNKSNKNQEENQNDFSEVYNNSKIFMISRAFNTIYPGHIIIDGYHNNSSGYGKDNKIILKPTLNPSHGIGIIYNDLGILTLSRSGWSHTKLQIYNFTGWISGHEKSRGFIKLYGSFSKLKLSGYRT
jgi:hypothetical protein